MIFFLNFYKYYRGLFRIRVYSCLWMFYDNLVTGEILLENCEFELVIILLIIG